jgi:hypothetical protein
MGSLLDDWNSSRDLPLLDLQRALWHRAISPTPVEIELTTTERTAGCHATAVFDSIVDIIPA